jgi:microcystin-dependent protein
MSEPYIGQISVFGFTFAPRNWAPCSGQIMAISQNTSLFSLLGTYYGGNGTTNFALPNLNGNVAIGQGALLGGSTYVLGETGGEGTVPLNRQTIPAHAHNFMATITQTNANAAAGAVLGRAVGTGGQPRNAEAKIYSNIAPDTVIDAPISTVGGSQGHDNHQPYLALTYCICIYGAFPPRG